MLEFLADAKPILECVFLLFGTIYFFVATFL